MTIDEAIESLKYDIEIDMYIRDIAPQLAEWLEKLQYIENIILKWNADYYNDEDTGIPDNEILEAIFNACNDMDLIFLSMKNLRKDITRQLMILKRN